MHSMFKSWHSCCTYKNSSVKDDLAGAPSLELDRLAAPVVGGYGKPSGRLSLLDPASITRPTTGQTVERRKYLHITYYGYFEIHTVKSQLVNVDFILLVDECLPVQWQTGHKRRSCQHRALNLCLADPHNCQREINQI